MTKHEQLRAERKQALLEAWRLCDAMAHDLSQEQGVMNGAWMCAEKIRDLLDAVRSAK